MIYWALAAGFGWVVLTAIAMSTMLVSVALREGVAVARGALWSEFPTAIGLASPGIILVLAALLKLALRGRQVRSRGIDDDR